MYQFRDKGFVSYAKQEGLGGAFVFQIFGDSQKNIWITTENNGVYKYNHQFFKNYSTKEGLNTSNVVSAMCNADGSIWFGTNKGISILKNEKFIEFPIKLTPPISCFFKDTKQNIWVGGLTGICCLVNTHTGYKPKYYSVPTKVNDYGVWSINEDANGNIWAGSYLAGIYKLEEDEFVNQTPQLKVNVESALDMEFDNDNWMYAATLMVYLFTM